jgi:GT2 family glycosyltransferase
MSPPTISVCICTRDRPESLRTCLAALAAGKELPDQVIVSDDGAAGGDTEAVCREFTFVEYIRGPGRGLSANRNAAIRAASGDYISFLDDDAAVSTDFVRISRRIVAEAAPSTVYTGRVIWNGVLHEAPGARTFLGHFGPTTGGPVENIHIACSNLFPAAAFNGLHFDEAIRFGYEEMDMADQLMSAGLRIEYRPELVNYHQTPEMTRESVGFAMHRARGRASTRRSSITSGTGAGPWSLRFTRQHIAPGHATARLRWERSRTCGGLSRALAEPTGMSAGQFSNGACELLCVAAAGELAGPFPCSRPQAGGKVGSPQVFENRSSQRVRIIMGNEHSVEAWRDDLRGASGVTGDHRLAHRHRFQHRDAEGLPG